MLQRDLWWERRTRQRFGSITRRETLWEKQVREEQGVMWSWRVWARVDKLEAQLELEVDAREEQVARVAEGAGRLVVAETEEAVRAEDRVVGVWEVVVEAADILGEERRQVGRRDRVVVEVLEGDIIED